MTETTQHDTHDTETQAPPAEQEPIVASGEPPAPVLGQIVHFVRGTRDPLPAIVTKVHDATTVDLTVFTGNPSQPMWIRREEKLITPQDEPATGWRWPW
jgi:hypothetical protein